MQWGYTPLLRAADGGHAEVAHFLLKSGSVFYEKNRVSAVKPVWVHVSLYCGWFETPPHCLIKEVCVNEG